ncbi:hypothetical protein PTNB29_00023 [Pyrenophora teres f. teres]|nr:hypothetical protein PTNB29_00023 [Pyrenophora teres f. teres]
MSKRQPPKAADEDDSLNIAITSLSAINFTPHDPLTTPYGNATEAQGIKQNEDNGLSTDEESLPDENALHVCDGWGEDIEQEEEAGDDQNYIDLLNGDSIHVSDYLGKEWVEAIVKLDQVQPLYIPGLLFHPHPWQLKGAAQGHWLCEQKDFRLFCCGDEMGLGKTMLAVLMAKLAQPQPGFCVVVSPKTVCTQWREEFERAFVKGEALKAIVLTDPKTTAHQLYQDMPDVVICSYEFVENAYRAIKRYKQGKTTTRPTSALHSDFWSLQKFPIKRLFLDEAHRIGNTRSARHIATRAIPALATALFSGTFPHNRWNNWAGPVSFAKHQPFLNLATFQHTFSTNNYDGVPEPEPQMARIKLLQRFLLRFTIARPASVLNLPGAEHLKSAFRLNQYDLNQSEYHFLEYQQAQLMAKRESLKKSRQGRSKGKSEDHEKKAASETSVTVDKTDLDAIHQQVSTDYTDNDDTPRTLWLRHLEEFPALAFDSARLKRVIALYEHVLDMIKAALHERFGIIALEYNGVTPDSVRLENLSQFKNYSHPSVPLLLSGKAGGEGINIQQASIMIQTEICWNRNAELQVYSRLLRPGQLHKVIIIRLQGKGCSIDDCIIGASMAGAADDFNSSDIEYEERPNKFLRCGGASLGRALARATEDRKESKVAFKQRPLYYGAPKTQNVQALWDNRFRSFLSSTLNVDPNQTPTCENIIRFLYAYPKHLISRAPSGAISFDTMRGAIEHIISTTQDRFPEFKLKLGEASRIKAVFSDLLSKGVITKDVSRTGQWLGSRIVYMLARALMQNALSQGCRSWDFVIQGALYLGLMVSTGSRVGDITRSDGLVGNKCVKYGDVEIQVKTDEAGNEDLVAVISLRYTKGKKDSSNVEHRVRIRMLSNTFNASDTIKLILVMALRTGNVEENTIEDLIATTKKRRGRSVVWKDPTLPLLAKATTGHVLKLSEPATTTQGQTIFRKATDLLGVLNVCGTHDIRRGVASETHTLSATKNFDGEARTAKLLNHSHSSTFRGVTASYIGEAVESRLEERLDESMGNMAQDAAKIAAMSYQAVHINKNDIQKYLLDNGLPDTESSRRKARRCMDKANREAWAKSNDATTFEVPDLAASSEVGSTTKRKRPAPAPVDSNEIPIDPRLENIFAQVGAETVLDGIVDPEELFDVDLFEDVDTNTTPTSSDPLSLPSIEFMDYFSRINLQSQTTKPVNGGSRDTSSVFLHTCDQGCLYTHPSKEVMQRHNKICKGIIRNVGPRVACPRGCGKDFSTDKGAKEHVRVFHNFVPKPCPRKDCDQTVLYPNPTSMSNHMSTVHRFSPRTCPNCPPGTTGATKIWKRKEGFRTHHIGMHRWTVEMFDAMLEAEVNEEV